MAIDFDINREMSKIEAPVISFEHVSKEYQKGIADKYHRQYGDVRATGHNFSNSIANGQPQKGDSGRCFHFACH